MQNLMVIIIFNTFLVVDFTIIHWVS